MYERFIIIGVSASHCSLSPRNPITTVSAGHLDTIPSVAGSHGRPGTFESECELWNGSVSDPDQVYVIIIHIYMGSCRRRVSVQLEATSDNQR